MKSHRIECMLYLSYDTSVWLRPAAAEMEGFGIHVQKTIFSAVSPEFPYIHFSIPLVKSQITEASNKNVNFTRRKIYFRAPRCFMTPETAEECQMLQAVVVL
jgi:hypothetical protein